MYNCEDIEEGGKTEILHLPTKKKNKQKIINFFPNW